jgi:O-antigen/teichoic acid export membrane protein
MLKVFLKNSVIYSLSRFVSQGISLFLVPFYTRIFTPNDYGVIDLLNICIAIVVLVLPLQITQAVALFYAASDDVSESRVIASSALAFTIFAFATFVLTSQLFPTELSVLIFEDPELDTLIRVVGVSTFFNGLFYFAQNQLKWMQKPVENATAAIVFSLVTIGCSVIFVLLLKLGVVGVFLGQLIGGFCGTILALFFGRSAYTMTFSTDHLRSMLHFSLPLVPAAFFILALSMISRLSIKQFLDLSDLGLYAIGFRVASVAIMIMVGITSSITPMIYASYQETGAPKEFEKAFRVTLLIAMIVTVAISLFGIEILTVLTTPAYYSAASVVPYLLVSNFVSGMVEFLPGLRLRKQTRFIAWIHFLTCIVSVATNIALIPRLGVVGAAIATMASSIFLFCAIAWYSQNRYYIPYTWMSYAIPALICALTISIGLLVDIDNMAGSILFKFALILFVGAASILCLSNKNERATYKRKLQLLIAG